MKRCSALFVVWLVVGISFQASATERHVTLGYVEGVSRAQVVVGERKGEVPSFNGRGSQVSGDQGSLQGVRRPKQWADTPESGLVGITVFMFFVWTVVTRRPLTPIIIAFKSVRLGGRLVSSWSRTVGSYVQSRQFMRRGSQQNEEKSNSSKQGTRQEQKHEEKCNDPYEVLGVTRSASKSEVRMAYIHKMATNHPDKVASLDMAIQAVALERTKQIQVAYRALGGR